MHELLFRGKSDGIWVEGYYYETKIYDEKLDPITGHFIHSIYCGEPMDYLIDPSTVGQYIGRESQSGERIFTGDIVRFYDALHGYYYTGVVDFQDCSFMIKCAERTHYRWMDYGEIDIIGNVHDHPELRKEVES